METLADGAVTVGTLFTIINPGFIEINNLLWLLAL